MFLILGLRHDFLSMLGKERYISRSGEHNQKWNIIYFVNEGTINKIIRSENKSFSNQYMFIIFITFIILFSLVLFLLVFFKYVLNSIWYKSDACTFHSIFLWVKLDWNWSNYSMNKRRMFQCCNFCNRYSSGNLIVYINLILNLNVDISSLFKHNIIWQIWDISLIRI